MAPQLIVSSQHASQALRRTTLVLHTTVAAQAEMQCNSFLNSLSRQVGAQAMEDSQHGCLCQAIDVNKHCPPQCICLERNSIGGKARHRMIVAEYRGFGSSTQI